MCSGFGVKVSDLGAAFLLPNPPKKPVTPIGLRSPELVLSGEIGTAQDVWSFGCLIFEFITGQALFNVDDLDCADEERDDDHLLQFCDTLGTLSEPLMSKWARSHIYFNEAGEKIKSYIGELPDGYENADTEGTFPTIEEMFDEAKRDTLGPEEAGTIKSLLRQILTYDAKKRPSTSDLLKHPWFALPS